MDSVTKGNCPPGKKQIRFGRAVSSYGVTRNYDIDEFRSLVLAAPDDTIEPHIDAANGRIGNAWAGPEIISPHG